MNDKQKQTPPNDIGNTIIKLEFTLGEIQAIITLLGNGPHNKVRALIDKIADQTNPQIPQEAEATQKPVPAADPV